MYVYTDLVINHIDRQVSVDWVIGYRSLSGEMVDMLAPEWQEMWVRNLL